MSTTRITPRSKRIETNMGLEMFSDVHIMTNRGKGYESIPSGTTASWHALKSARAPSDPEREKRTFEIIAGPHGIYVVAGFRTRRTDHTGRGISNFLILRAEDMRAALHLFDVRHSLLGWSEKRWQKRGGGSDSDLLKILKKTSRKTTEADLATWQSHSLTERHPVPHPTGFAGIMHRLRGSPVAHVEKQVGTLHYHEE